jgi:hypothetical protein
VQRYGERKAAVLIFRVDHPERDDEHCFSIPSFIRHLKDRGWTTEVTIAHIHRKNLLAVESKVES